MPDISIDELENLVRLMEQKKIFFVDVKRENRRVRLRRFPFAEKCAKNNKSVENELNNTSPTESKTYMIISLLVGVFYRAISHDSKPVAEVGDHIKKGQTVAYIETMKIMHDVKSDRDGIIKSFLSPEAHVVEYGQPIVELEEK